jgi:sporulation protein YlmC with PRC-barrel domain
MNSKTRALCLACLLGAFASTAVADPPVAGKTTLGITVAEAELVATGWRASKLISADVRNEKGDKIGKIDDIIVAPNGQLSIAVIDVGGFLGIGTHRVAIPVRQLVFSKDPSKTTLQGASKESLKALPKFEYSK